MEVDRLGKVMAVLAAAYPNAAISAETMAVYCRTLADVPANILEAAALAHISESKFFPTVAELRERALNLSAGGALPTAAEAWAEVIREMRRVGIYDKPKFSHEMIHKAVQAMGWYDLCVSENPVADRAHFFKVYETYYRRYEQDAKMLPEVRELAKLGPGAENTRNVLSLIQATANSMGMNEKLG